jgi:hypothetical protein
VSLIEKYCYRVIAAAANARDVLKSPPLERPRLVLLGNGDTGALVGQADACRREWPSCKIVLLLERSGTEDQGFLVNASPNAYLPMSLSHLTLLEMLDVIVHEESDVFVSFHVRGGHRNSELTDPQVEPKQNG